MKNIREHPQRYTLTNEIHARPFAELRPPEQASHFALLSGEGTESANRDHLIALCDRYGIAHPSGDANHFSADCGAFRLKWERHTEVTTYTFFRRGPFDDPFAAPASSLVPGDWLEALPGELVVAAHVAFEPRDAAERSPDDLARHFVADSLCSSFAAGGAARLWTDFRIHEDGFGRILIRDFRLGAHQAGRLVQRLLEIETYRTLALLALPPARETGPKITRIGRDLARLTAGMNDIGSVEDDHRLLDQLTRLAAEIEGVTAATAYRFSAARAYYALIGERIAELREDRVEGFQTIGEFMDRRLAPAMRTCESVAARQEVLSGRVARAANLLRTRVDISLEGQNRDLLASMNRRARLQLRLQQTLEGLSVVAVTYYLVGLLGYVFSTAKSAGIGIDTHTAQALSILPVAVLVWLALHRLRRAVMAGSKGGEE